MEKKEATEEFSEAKMASATDTDATYIAFNMSQNVEEKAQTNIQEKEMVTEEQDVGKEDPQAKKISLVETETTSRAVSTSKYDVEQQAPKEKKRNESIHGKRPPQKQERNKWFKDVEETGSWGALPKKEIFISLIASLFLIAGAIVLIVVLISNKDDSATVQASLAPSLTPTFTHSLVPTVLEIENKPEDILEQVLTKIALSPSNSDTKYILPGSLDGFEKDQAIDTSLSPQIRAMSWLLYIDPTTQTPLESPLLIARYVCAVLFYKMGGETNSWTDSSNWLTEKSVCEWSGIVCDRQGTHVKALKMASFTLRNKIPDELALLGNLEEIMFRSNKITGTIPSGLLELTNLRYLFLDNNQMTGTIPTEIASIGLYTIMLQLNNFNGKFPFEFCFGGYAKPPLGTFFIDCEGNGTPGLSCICCVLEDHCY